MITALLEDSSVLSWSVKPKMPLPNGGRQATIAIQAQLMTSIVRTTKTTWARRVLLLSGRNWQTSSRSLSPTKRMFCVVVARPYYMDELVAKVASFLAGIERKNKSP